MDAWSGGRKVEIEHPLERKEGIGPEVLKYPQVGMARFDYPRDSRVRR
jgi:hypothetical protein